MLRSNLAHPTVALYPQLTVWVFMNVVFFFVLAWIFQDSIELCK